MDTISEDDYNLPKPRQVTNAFYLILASIVIGFLSSIVNVILFWQERIARYPTIAICLGLMLLMSIWLAYKINTGRNWARLVFLALFVLGLFDLVDLVRNFANYPLFSSFSALSILLRFVAILFLFQKPSSEWFKSQTPRKTIPKTTQDEKKEENKRRFKEEFPSVTAFQRDWQNLTIGRRILWVMRIVLFLGVIVTMFLPWYRDDLAGWQIGLGFAYLSCGLGLVPFIGVIVFGFWSILRPGSRVLWGYRIALFLWIAFSVLAFAIYAGKGITVAIAISAGVVEAVDIIVARFNPTNPLRNDSH